MNYNNESITDFICLYNNIIIKGSFQDLLWKRRFMKANVPRAHKRYNVAQTEVVPCYPGEEDRFCLAGIVIEQDLQLSAGRYGPLTLCVCRS